MVKALPKKVYEAAYEYTSPCSGCEYYYDPRCPMLRSWAKEVIVKRHFPGHIDTCSSYLDWTEVRKFEGVTLKEDA